jgi:hypothetical protein
VRGFHNSDYRELLNVEIRDASARAIPEDHIPLEQSQIGLSIWTSKEKEDFFSALSRLGRDNFREIALRVGSKSEVEVQEYIHVLHQATKDRNLEDIRNYPETGYQRYQPLLAFTDHPAAFEISEECCSVLERAGDAVSNRLESYEAQEEEATWGDIWLLTNSVSKFLESKGKSEGGEKEIQEILPAANLLNLKNWLNLPHRIFMNPAAPREEDNWQKLAEPGETPAIRATAFEDFHSLTVSITKRLVLTTLFQTMTRLRVTNANKIKHAQICLQDVDAAVKMLGLKSNSSDFWCGCPRRCTLNVYDDSRSNSDEIMTYNEVEQALGAETLVRSRSRSQSANQFRASSRPSSRADSEDLTESVSELQDSDSNDGSIHSPQFVSDLEDYESLEITGDELAGSNKRRGESRRKRIEEAKANKRAQEEYTQAFDEEANRLEEQRLWTLLRQDPPFEFKPEPVELPDRPKNIREGVGAPDWRDNLEYWSQWETLPTPVPAENFARNRKSKSDKERRQGYRTRSASHLSRRTIGIEMVDDESEEDRSKSGPDSAEEEVSDSSEDMPEQFLGGSDDEGAVDTEGWSRALRSPSFGADDFSEAEVAVKGEDEA